MIRIGVSELRENLSRVLRRVRSGETIEVTDHGRPVARLVPVAAAAAGLDDLIAGGLVIPPREGAVLPEPLDIPSTMTSEEAVAALRGG